MFSMNIIQVSGMQVHVKISHYDFIHDQLDDTKNNPVVGYIFLKKII